MLTIRLARIGKKKEALLPCRGDRADARHGMGECVKRWEHTIRWKKPAEIKLNADRIKYWLGVGPEPSDTVQNFLKLQKRLPDAHSR